MNLYQDPPQDRRAWLLLSLVTSAATLFLMAILLFSCGRKPEKPAQAPAPTIFTDTARQTLVKRAEASARAADQATLKSKPTVDTYETLDSLYRASRVRLP